MKRGFVLLALVALVVWLVNATPIGVQSAPASSAPVAAAPEPVAPVDECCAEPNESDPHWECFNNTCMQFNGCGVNVDCSTCGCDIWEEWACINDGGDWDPFTCTCTYGCDPDGSQEAYCWSIEGEWDPFTCTCYPPTQCNPGPPILTYSDNWSDYYCDGYQWVDCEYGCDTYVQYCQNGSVYNQWTECTSTCFPSGEYCGGGGGGDDCGTWYRPDSKDGQNLAPNNMDDCWCDSDWGICCDWDWYCWEM